MSDGQSRQGRCPECGAYFRIMADEWADGCPRCGFEYDKDEDEDEQEDER